MEPNIVCNKTHMVLIQFSEILVKGLLSFKKNLNIMQKSTTKFKNEVVAKLKSLQTKSLEFCKKI